MQTLKKATASVAVTPITPKQFQKKILNWFDRFGRKNLPWQMDKTPYKVWLSEIMLQQTQVNTVIPYFNRFIEHFPRVETLAAASLDTVLQLWAGLGYYARARNLHKTAKIICAEYAGQFPRQSIQLQDLPGIGRSTAGAILSLAYDESAPILDGNVKRVLARMYAIMLPLNDKHTLDLLWQLATTLTPKKRTADFTQAMMDLGSTICTRSQPQCGLCYLQDNCKAHQQKIQHIIPVTTKKKKIPTRQTTMLIFYNESANQVLMEKRNLQGIWGGLWSFPEIMNTHATQKEIISLGKKEYPHFNIQKIIAAPLLKHIFTHFQLQIAPFFIYTSVLETSPTQIQPRTQEWVDINQITQMAIPAPVNKILKTRISVKKN